MGEFLRSGAVINLDYVRTRCGEEITGIASPPVSNPTAVRAGVFRGVYRRLRAQAGRVKRSLLTLIGRDDYVRFSESGELHRWMYDRVSLARLLRACGFTDVCRVTAEESRIPGWSEYGLDADPANGLPRKPGSLFVEAIKK